MKFVIALFCAQTVLIPSVHKITKNHKQKVVNIHNDFFKLYQFLMKNFQCYTVPSSSFFILTKLITT